VQGGAGDVCLIGGRGADVLFGGQGAVHFIYRTLPDSTVAVPGQDVIVDFSSAEGDKIDLSGIDADTRTPGDQAFTLVPNFNHHAAQLVVTAQHGGFLVRADVNGDGVPDFGLFVDGSVAPKAGDFIL
jgi:Ca2+-binding RTX toxin-like protein